MLKRMVTFGLFYGVRKVKPLGSLAAQYRHLAKHGTLDELTPAIRGIINQWGKDTIDYSHRAYSTVVWLYRRYYKLWVTEQARRYLIGYDHDLPVEFYPSMKRHRLPDGRVDWGTVTDRATIIGLDRHQREQADIVAEVYTSGIETQRKQGRLTGAPVFTGENYESAGGIDGNLWNILQATSYYYHKLQTLMVAKSTLMRRYPSLVKMYDALAPFSIDNINAIGIQVMLDWLFGQIITATNPTS